MATLPVNDRLTGPFIATAGQTDFPADFPLLVIPGTDPEDGVVLRVVPVVGADVEVTGDGFDIVDVASGGFTVRLVTPSIGGERVWIIGRLAQARMRALASGGAVRTDVLEDDARESAAKQQEMARDISLTLRVAPGETPPDAGALADLAEAAPAAVAAAAEATAAAAEAVGATVNKLDKELPATSPDVFDGGYSANVILDKPHIPDRFGATPAMLEGLEDATAVIQRMLDASQDNAKDRLKPLDLGAGKFVFDGQATIDLGNYEGSVLRITGAGNNGTKLVMDRLNRVGGIKINRPNNMEHVHVSDVAFCSVLPQDDWVFPAMSFDPDDNNGIALHITTDITPGSPGYGLQDDRAVRVERVHIHGIGPNSGEAHYVGVWGEAGIRIDYAWFPIIRDCAWRGVYQPAFDAAHAGNNQHCLLLNHNYAPEIEACLFNGYWGVGAANVGKEPNGTPSERFPHRWEGGRVRHCIFGGMLTDGLVLSHNFVPGTTLQSPGFQILDNHINARRFGVRINGHRQIQITGNEFYAQTEPFAGEPLQAGVHLSDCGTIDAANNMFDEPGRYISDDEAWCAYRLEDDVVGFHCDDRMAHGGIGVRVGAGQVSRSLDIAIRKRGKAITGVWAPLKLVVDKSASAVFSEEIDQDLWDVKRFVSRTADTNVSPIFQIDRERDDFGAVSAPKLGALSWGGLNSAGARIDALWMEGAMERNTAGNEATGVVLGGYVNGLFGSFIGVSGSSGQMFINVGQVIHSSANSNNVFARPRYELYRDRTDYATKPDAKLAEYAFAGRDSAGEKIVTSLIEGSFKSNLAGLATSIMRFVTLQDGVVFQPLVLEGDHAIIDELWTGSVTLQNGLTPVGYVTLRDTFGSPYKVLVTA